MQVKLNLDLPRDARYVPLMRNVAGCLLSDLGAPSAAIADVQLALSEACANVVRHAAGTSDYHVGFAVRDDGCEIEVADEGPGFPPPADATPPAADAESGRGLALMQALVDDLFVLSNDGDSIVRLRKTWSPLEWGLDAMRPGDIPSQPPADQGARPGTSGPA